LSGVFDVTQRGRGRVFHVEPLRRSTLSLAPGQGGRQAGGHTQVLDYVATGHAHAPNMQKIGAGVTPSKFAGPDLLCWSPLEASVPRISMLIRLAQAVFFGALIFTCYSAVISPAHAVQLVPWDKAEHFIAFYTLTGLGVAAFPRRRLWVIGVLLSALGALIEFVQGLSIVHRDRDFWDWVADTLAIIAALSPMLLVWWRAQVRSGQKNIDI
jgi:hypothetical protein